MLRVCATREALHRVRVDLLVVGFAEDERPLRGSAGLVDWRLCGALSRLIRAGRIGGARGEALLMPAGGGLRAGRVLALGLGAPDAGPAGAAPVADALARAGALQVERVALAAPFAAEGDGERGLDRLLAAAGSGWRAGGRAQDGLLLLLARPARRESLARWLQARAGAPPEGVSILPAEGARRASPAGLRDLSTGT